MRASAHKFSQKIFGEGGLRLISTLFVLFLARTLGAEDFGRYSTALAYAALCIVFVDLGTNSILTREMARHPENRVRIAESSHFLKIAASVGSWLILWAITVLLHFPPEQRYLTLCLGILVIGQTLTEYFSALLCGIEEMGWEATLKVANRLFALSLGFIALARHQSLHVIVTMMVIGTAAGYIISIWILRRRFGTFGIAVDRAFLRSLLITSLPLFGSVILLIAYDSQDVLLLNAFHFPQRSIGWFSAAMKIMDVIRVYPVLVLGVFFPTLSKLHISDPDGFKQKQRKITIFMTVSLTALAGVLYVSAPWIIQLLYKDDFLPASALLRLLTPVIIVMGLNYTWMQLLVALNRERKILMGAVIVCAANLGLTCLLLPRCGLPGTCYALLGSEIIYFIFLRSALLSAGRE